MRNTNVSKEFDLCQRIWEELNDSERNLMFELCGKLRNIKEEKAEIINQSDYEILVKKKIIRISQNECTFQLCEMFNYVTSHKIIHSKNLNIKTNIEILSDLDYLKIEYGMKKIDEFQKIFCFIIVILTNSFHRNSLVKEIVEEKSKTNKFWDITESINMAIPLLDLEKEEFYGLLDIISELFGRDLTSGFFYSAVYDMAKRKPIVAKKIIEQCVFVKSCKNVELIRNLLMGSSAVSPEDLAIAINSAKEWTNSENPSLRQVGLISLMEFSLETKFDVDKFVDILESKICDPNQDITSTISNCLTQVGLCIPNLSEKCFCLLGQFKSPGNIGEVNHGIACGLSRYRAGKNELIEKYLNFLSDTPNKNKGTIQVINEVLFPYTSSNPAIIWEFIETWICCHEKCEPVIDEDLFLITIQQTINTNRELGIFNLTKWFVSDELKLVEESRRIVSEAKIQEFSKEVITNLSKRETIYITEKMLVGFFESHQIFNLFFSIIENTKHFLELKEFFIEALDYLSNNFPGAAENKLREFKPNEKNTCLKEYVNEASKKLLQRQKEFLSTRFLIKNELPSSAFRIKKFHEFENKRLKQVSNTITESNQHSLINFISKIMIGRGNRSFFMYNNPSNLYTTDKKVFSNPESFAEISQTIELPKGEITNPEGEIYQRLIRLNLRLSDIKVNDE